MSEQGQQLEQALGHTRCPSKQPRAPGWGLRGSELVGGACLPAQGWEPGGLSALRVGPPESGLSQIIPRGTLYCHCCVQWSSVWTSGWAYNGVAGVGAEADFCPRCGSETHRPQGLAMKLSRKAGCVDVGGCVDKEGDNCIDGWELRNSGSVLVDQGKDIAHTHMHTLSIPHRHITHTIHTPHTPHTHYTHITHITLTTYPTHRHTHILHTL